MPTLSDLAAFGKGLGSGARGAAVGTWEGIKGLAKGGYALATDAGARDAAYDAAKRAAAGAAAYGREAMADPAKVYRDARDTAGAAYTAVDEFRRTATPEQWGEVMGAGAFEVGTMFVPVGATAKLGKAGKLAGAADKAADAGRAAKAFPKAVPSPIRPCQAVVKSTIDKLKLRPDLDERWFKPDGSLDWPANGGFAGLPKPKTLERGAVIDRYSEFTGLNDRGSFLSPSGTPYEQRALPYDPARMSHTRYEVVKEFEVDAGPAASAFDQIGGGTQYKTRKPVKDLVREGYLREIKP